MPVPGDNRSVNYQWQMPAVGGDIGSWGGILNTVFGEDGATGATKGIDQVIWEIQGALDLIEAAIALLDAAVEVLEEEVAPSFYARSVLGSVANVPHNSFFTLVFDTSDFDEGGVKDGGDMTVPTGGAGAWQIRAVIAAPAWGGSGGDGDNARSWQLTILRNSAVIAEARSIYANDGYDSNSGDVSVMATVIAEVTDAQIAAGVTFSVRVRQYCPDSTITVGIQAVNYQTYFEATRVAPKEVVAP